jgi:hypothetical protein
LKLRGVNYKKAHLCALSGAKTGMGSAIQTERDTADESIAAWRRLASWRDDFAG